MRLSLFILLSYLSYTLASRKSSNAQNSVPIASRRSFHVHGGSLQSPVSTLNLIDGEEMSMTESRILSDSTVFPLTLKCSSDSKKVDVVEWVKVNKDRLVSELLPKHGAIVLRGFEVKDEEAFSRIIKSLDLEEQPYIGGNAVRTVVADRVFTSNESPPTERIPFHHEMAQVPRYPTRVMFYCQVPSREGGETPIVRSDEVCDILREEFPDLYERFKEEGVKYVRVAPMDDDPTSALGRGWKSTFGTSSREKAEVEMKKDGFEWEWKDNDELLTKSKKLSAIRMVDGKEVFFNQVIAAYSGWNDSRNVASRAVVFGETGDLLPSATMKAFIERVNGIAVSFEWKQGDVLLIDNRQVMHSRAPFVKPRRVLASLAR
ncbi:hypothetical protein TrLO_g2665 [Triparma laevis f. longispina]|uniref:TauD/TfdA-like domain-containing protein n=1 Tax=Triparma laevis f. longispina TaxID=1714387 RepID=A0A9W7AP42_9STRA|nr:hypothetical protein TrLO_g2665 [Triparma laevis f. longispina]